MEKQMEILAKRLCEERRKQKLNQEDLAHIAGVSLNFISQLESEKETVQFNKLLAVLQSLGLEFKLQYGKKGVSE